MPLLDWLPMLPGVGQLVGNIFQQSSANDAAQKQMEFQERMSSTAHQREVKDLIAAGLNPILSANKTGAPMPSGAMPQAFNIMSGVTSSAAEVAELQDKLKTSQQNRTIRKPVETVAESANQGVEAVKAATEGAVTVVFDKFFDAITNTARPSDGPARPVGDWKSDLGKLFNPLELLRGYTELKQGVEKGNQSRVNSAADAVRSAPRFHFEGDPDEVLKEIYRVKDKKERAILYDGFKEWMKNRQFSKPITR